jgi:hypothetical protein
MTLTPEQMRRQTEEARKKAKREAQAAARAKAAKEKAEAAEIMSRKEQYIKTVEYRMAEAGTGTMVAVKVNTESHWDDRDKHEPVLQSVVDHFKALGFKAHYSFYNITEYYGDGAGPGEDEHYITVDWSEDE